MITFDDCIIDLFDKGLITEGTAISFATNRAVVNRGVDAIKKGRGEQTSVIANLEVDKGYGKQKPEAWR